MSEIKHPAHLEEEKNPVAELRNIWDRYGKQASYVLIAIVVLVGGYFGYRNWVAEPNEKQALSSHVSRRTILPTGLRPAGAQRR